MDYKNCRRGSGEWTRPTTFREEDVPILSPPIYTRLLRWLWPGATQWEWYHVVGISSPLPSEPEANLDLTGEEV